MVPAIDKLYWYLLIARLTKPANKSIVSQTPNVFNLYRISVDGPKIDAAGSSPTESNRMERNWMEMITSSVVWTVNIEHRHWSGKKASNDWEKQKSPYLKTKIFVHFVWCDKSLFNCRQSVVVISWKTFSAETNRLIFSFFFSNLVLSLTHLVFAICFEAPEPPKPQTIQRPKKSWIQNETFISTVVDFLLIYCRFLFERAQ